MVSLLTRLNPYYAEAFNNRGNAYAKASTTAPLRITTKRSDYADAYNRGNAYSNKDQ